jgi:hypothetical protein
MNTYGYTGTNYVIPYFLSHDGYQSLEDLHLLHDAGWDIAGHGGYDLRPLSQKDLTAEINRIGLFFSTYPFTGSDHFAYPNGSYNVRVAGAVATQFTTARNIDGLAQPMGSISPYNINAKTVSRSTTLEEIKGWIDDAKEERSWLILVWHALPEFANQDTEYPKEGFIAVLDYIKKSGVSVLPVSKILTQ